MMRKNPQWLSLLLLVATAPCLAQVSVMVGDHELLPDTPNQSVQVQVSGVSANQSVAIFDVYARILPVDNAGPVLTGLDLVNATIFSGKIVGDVETPNLPDPADASRFAAGLGFLDPEATESGVLATLLVDTTGVFNGDFALNFSDVLLKDDQFASTALGGAAGPLVTNVQNGTLTIVPEPAAFTLLATVCMGGIMRRRRLI